MSTEPAESSAGASSDENGPDSPFSRAATLSDALAELETRSLRRRLRRIDSPAGPYVTVAGKRLCCLCSNNYLGLAHHPQVVRAVAAAVQTWGWGAGASRLVSGHTALHEQLETALAAFEHQEAALVCATGYQANLAAIRALAGRDDAVFVDRLNHASIIDACRGSGARVRVFGHRDDAKLERLLAAAHNARRRIIVTDSLFSMDGDLADLPRLVELRRRYDALLCIDEAHATGVLGEGGQGLAQQMKVAGQVDVVVGTLSKALGGIGGFVAASRTIIDWIINTAGSFIYTTAIPPAACAGALAALEIITSREGAQRRERLLSLAAGLRRELARRGYDIAGSQSQIVPLLVGDARAAVELSERLEAAGFLIPAIRPPTVPRGQARLRISLCADHGEADVERLLDALDRAGSTGVQI